LNFYDSKNKISCIKFKIINSIWLLLLNIIIYSETYLNFGFTILGHAAQKSKLHHLQYDEGGNHMAEAEEEVLHFWFLSNSVEGYTNVLKIELKCPENVMKST
jgi:hypothetical protein